MDTIRRSAPDAMQQLDQRIGWRNGHRRENRDSRRDGTEFSGPQTDPVRAE